MSLSEIDAKTTTQVHQIRQPLADNASCDPESPVGNGRAPELVSKARAATVADTIAVADAVQRRDPKKKCATPYVFAFPNGMRRWDGVDKVADSLMPHVCKQCKEKFYFIEHLVNHQRKKSH